MDELFRQTRGIYVNEPPQSHREIFTKQIAFNAIPQVGAFAMKVQRKTRVISRLKLPEFWKKTTAYMLTVPILHRLSALPHM